MNRMLKLGKTNDDTTSNGFKVSIAFGYLLLRLKGKKSFLNWKHIRS